MKSKSKIIGVFLFLLILSLISSSFFIPEDYDLRTMMKSAPIGTGYAAKMLCSGVFVSGRQPDSLWNEDLELMRNNFVRGKIDYENKSVDAYVFGFIARRTAVYRGDCGCTLMIDVSEDDFMKECRVDPPVLPSDIADSPWPMGDVISETDAPDGIDREQLDRSMDWAFAEHDTERPVRTRAAIVLYHGRIVAERYAEGYSKETRLLGWSMTKSVTSALIGILVRQGKIDIYEPAPIPEWKKPGDTRSTITTDQLLRMSSGLEFIEEYEDNPDSDAGYMFFTVKDMAAYAARKPLVAKPDEKFSYSSGTTMLLSRIIREAVGGTFQDYLSFPREELFDKLGMRSALIEPDPSGTMVGAGFMYATARDWARFGMLYYNDGVWNGERILPEGWVKYTRTPSSTSAEYGAQWWLNVGGKERWMPNCPTDIYSAWGHEGQFITIVPSRKTIVVRLGQTFDEEKNWDHDYFISNILKAMPN